MPTPASTLAERVLPWAVFALSVVYAACLLHGMSVVDTDRDFASAAAIALNGEWIALGPRIGGVWSLGPAWFYLLALPLWLWPNIVAPMAVLTLASTAKIALAAALGRRLGGPMHGLTLAALVCLPGWWLIGVLAASHPSATESAVLATALATLAARERALRGDAVYLWLGLCGLLFALALHAHPTVIVLAPLLAALLWPAVRNAPLAAGAFTAAALLPFLPLLFSSGAEATLAATTQHLDGLRIGAQLAQLPAQLLGFVLGGPALVESLLQGPEARPWLLPTLAGLLWLPALGLALGRGRQSKLARWLCLYLLAAVAGVALMRSFVAPWMLYALLPLAAVLQLLGLDALDRAYLRSRALPRLALALAALALGLLLLQLAALREARSQGELWLPRRAASDVAAFSDQHGDARTHLALLDLGRLARRLCRAEAPWRPHGELAATLQLGGVSAAALACADGQAQLGGQGPGLHRVGLPRGLLAREFGFAAGANGSPHDFAGFVLIEPSAVLWPSMGTPLRVDPEYWPERLSTRRAGGLKRWRLHSPCPQGDWLQVSDLGFGMNAMALQVTRFGTPVDADVTTWVARYWRCTGAPLELDVEAADPALVDIVRWRLPDPMPVDGPDYGLSPTATEPAQ
jgi:hypothetical protein